MSYKRMSMYMSIEHKATIVYHTYRTQSNCITFICDIQHTYRLDILPNWKFLHCQSCKMSHLACLKMAKSQINATLSELFVFSLYFSMCQSQKESRGAKVNWIFTNEQNVCKLLLLVCKQLLNKQIHEIIYEAILLNVKQRSI